MIMFIPLTLCHFFEQEMVSAIEKTRRKVTKEQPRGRVEITPIQKAKEYEPINCLGNKRI